MTKVTVIQERVIFSLEIKQILSNHGPMTDRVLSEMMINIDVLFLSLMTQ